VSPRERLEALLALAREVDLEVRRIAAGEAATSGVCRLRGEVFVLLAAGDPPERQLAVLAGALRDHRGDACEARYLPPAVRAALETAG
jgi:hypothetical protein